MAAERKPRKPAVIGKKQIFKITREVRELYMRAKYMNFFEHAYVPLVDTVEYIIMPTWFDVVLPDYGRLHGSVPLIFLTTEFRISVEVLREHVEGMWSSVADLVAGKIVNASEIDKAVPDEVKEFEVLDISELYIDNIRKLLRASIRR